MGATAWPAEMVETFVRDPGGLAILPAVIWWIVVAGWVMTTDRLSRDAVKRKEDPDFWNPLLAMPFFTAALLAWWIPWFIAGLFLMLLAWWGPMVAYATSRNRRAARNEQIITFGHARRILSGLLERVGVEIDAEAGDGTPPPPAVVLGADAGASAKDQESRSAAASGSPGFAGVSRLISDAVTANASAVLFELAGQETSVREEIDGIWHPRKIWEQKREKFKRFEQCVAAPPMPRQEADAMRETLLLLCGADPRVGRPRFSGRFMAKIDGKPWMGRLLTQSSGNTEKLLVRWDPQAAPFKTLGDLGMSEPDAARITGLLNLEKGLVIVAAPPASGGSTSFDRIVTAADRLVRNFVSIEDAASPPREIQNVKPYRFDVAAGTTPVQALALAMREYPQAIVVENLKDPDLARELVVRAEAEQLVVVGMQATDAVDAIQRILALGVERHLLAASLLGVVAERLVRKLCPKCRAEQPTPPELLVKLHTTAERLPHIYVPSKEGCRLCHGTGFRGRTGIFEVAGGPTVRLAIEKKVDVKTSQKAAVKDGMKPLADSAMRLVVDGRTSLDEVQRVFRSSAKGA